MQFQRFEGWFFMAYRFHMHTDASEPCLTREYGRFSLVLLAPNPRLDWWIRHRSSPLVMCPILILRLTAPSGRRAVRVAYGPGLLDRASSSGSNFTFSFLSIFLCVLFLSSTFLCSIFCLQLFFCLFLLFFLNFCVKKFSPNFLSHNLLLNFFGS